MKKAVLPLLLLCLAPALRAQEATNEKPAQDYNKWTLELGGGINTASNPLTPGYDISGYNFYSANFGVRYMFNTKFGLKLGVTYDRLKEDDGSPEFETKVMGANLQGYANIGRILEFETWTKRLNLLGHVGVGVSQLKNDERIKYEDHVGNFLIGLTGQFKVSPRVTIFGDFTMNNTFAQDRTWDGGDYSQAPKQGFDGTLYQATIGLSVALGKHAEHADWYVYNVDDKLNDLDKRVGDLETMMNDSDKDGVPDYLDAEPNTIAGVAVDSKGRTIDKNGNGVPDELESYLDSNYDKKGTVTNNGSGDLKDLINGGYVNAFFDFGKDKPNAQSVTGINFLIKYLKENPNSSVDVVGYADEVGDSEFNKALSARRAENVKKILTDAGVKANFNIVGNGEDTSVAKSSAFARQTVRRVAFVIK